MPVPTRLLAVLLGLGPLLLGQNLSSARTPKVQLELGYLRSWHAEPYITRKDWIQVPQTWQDPRNFPGSSQYAFTFRDTSWKYSFNHHHPMFTSRIRLKSNPDARWQFFFMQCAMWNSWHQLSFMLGGEASYRFNPKMRAALQIGALSGYHLLHTLERGSLMSIDGPDGGVYAGANLTVDYELNRKWRMRLAGNHAIIGLGLFYAWSLPSDPAPRT